MVDDEPFLAEIYAHPDDPAAYLVYADVLQARGDPRGELIVLQHADRDASAYLANHPELDLPKSSPWPFATATPLPVDVIKWFCGFARSIEAHRLVPGDVEALLTHPSARFVRKLHLYGTGNMSSGIVCPLVAKHLARTIEELDVHPNASDIFDRDVTVLAPCTRLRTLHMSGMDDETVTIKAFRALRAFPQLESVSLPMTLTDAACAELVGLPIKVVFSYLAHLTDAGVADLAKLPLRSIDIDGAIAPSLHPLAHHATLADLTLHSAFAPSAITPEIAHVFGTLPALVRLNIYGSTIDDAGVAALAPLAPHLRSLTIGSTRTTNAACSTLATMRALDYLDVDASGPGLRQLAPLTELECLLLRRPDLDDDGVRELRPFHKLARLSLGGPNRITDACIDHLAALPKLELLNIARTAITPAGIDRLARLPNLKTLFVNLCDPATIARAKQIGHLEVPDSVEGFDDSRDP